jgi:hypothetical protein
MFNTNRTNHYVVRKAFDIPDGGHKRLKRVVHNILNSHINIVVLNGLFLFF